MSEGTAAGLAAAMMKCWLPLQLGSKLPQPFAPQAAQPLLLELTQRKLALPLQPWSPAGPGRPRLPAALNQLR